MHIYKQSKQTHSDIAKKIRKGYTGKQTCGYVSFYKYLYSKRGQQNLRKWISRCVTECFDDILSKQQIGKAR